MDSYNVFFHDEELVDRLKEQLDDVFQTDVRIHVAETNTTLSCVFSDSDKIETARDVIRSYDPEAYEEYDSNSSKVTFQVSNHPIHLSWITKSCLIILLIIFWNIVSIKK